MVHQRDPADRFYVIVRGTVRATRVDDDGSEVAANVWRTATTSVSSACCATCPAPPPCAPSRLSVLLTLTRDRFLRMLERAPELRDALRRDYPELVSASGEGGT